MSTSDSSDGIFIIEKRNFVISLNQLIEQCKNKTEKPLVYTDKQEIYDFKQTNEKLDIDYKDMENLMKGNICYNYNNKAYIYLTKTNNNQNNFALPFEANSYHFYGDIETFPSVWPYYNEREGATFDLSNLTLLKKIESFYNVKWLSKIVFPSTIKSLKLDISCFDGCGLTEVTIPDIVIDIGTLCFANCASLTTVNLPENIRTLPDQCFTDCKSLKNIDLRSVKTLGELCFSRSGLTSISSLNVTELGARCFSGCESLIDVTLPNVTELGNNCFIGCKNLTKIGHRMTVHC